jgi:hypothetical protein
MHWCLIHIVLLSIIKLCEYNELKNLTYLGPTLKTLWAEFQLQTRGGFVEHPSQT